MSKNRKSVANRLAIKYYIGQVTANKKWSIPALLLPGISTILVSYAPPLVIASMIRHFNGNIPSSWNATIPFIFWFMVIWSFGEVIWRIAFLAINRTSEAGFRNLYRIALDELLKKDMEFFANNFAGALTKRALAFGRYFESFFDIFSFRVFGNLLPLIFSVIILSMISPILVLVLLGMLALTCAIAFPFIKKRQSMVYDRETAATKVSGHIADVVGNVSAVKSFAHEAHEMHQHKSLVNYYAKTALRSWDYHVTHVDMSIAPFYVMTSVLGLIVAILTTKDANAMAAVFVTFTYFAQSTRILFEFNQVFRGIETAMSEAAQFTELLIDSPKVKDEERAKTLVSKDSHIAFKNVSFTHVDNGEALFHNFSLDIKPGEHIGLVGHSGAGKSTVTNLLLRFMNIDGGSIAVDSQNIARVTQESLRQNIAYVPQEPALFHRSLKENIAYGKSDASDNEVKKAAELAHAAEFIEKLPKKYETLVGERGVKLSGGQRQRVAIARAILKNAPILVLDEATSALDSESEKYIQSALRELMKGRTSIVIAHRLSTIQKMDRIVVLDEGRIVEEGSHKELLGKNGVYAKLWAHQSGGFIEE